ncbi:hypothetical protein DL95DRAFT_444529 [Leptodontidium sp. 2 PMI_412]|nr:hypothetical protein DL95DRAFT_444529 [Leptodontidium sp. 2 PMI_412]
MRKKSEYSVETVNRWFLVAAILDIFLHTPHITITTRTNQTYSDMCSSSGYTGQLVNHANAVYWVCCACAHNDMESGNGMQEVRCSTCDHQRCYLCRIQAARI